MPLDISAKHKQTSSHLPGTHRMPSWSVARLDGSEGLNVYVSTKWTQTEIEAAERQRLDDIESTLSMRTASSSFSQSKSRSRQGVMHENRIVHAM